VRGVNLTEGEPAQPPTKLDVTSSLSRQSERPWALCTEQSLIWTCKSKLFWMIRWVLN